MASSMQLEKRDYYPDYESGFYEFVAEVRGSKSDWTAACIHLWKPHGHIFLDFKTIQDAKQAASVFQTCMRTLGNRTKNLLNFMAEITRDSEDGTINEHRNAKALLIHNKIEESEVPWYDIPAPVRGRFITNTTMCERGGVIMLSETPAVAFFVV